MELRVSGLPTATVEGIRAGGPDANGRMAERRRCEDGANPCRHCLTLIPEGEEKLVLAHRPFGAPQPYAETGPIFLHPEVCPRYVSDTMPGWFAFLDPAVLRGYDAEDWIRYDTGRVVEGVEVALACREILADPTIRYVHVRSKFGCYQARVDRAADG